MAAQSVHVGGMVHVLPSSLLLSDLSQRRPGWRPETQQTRLQWPAQRFGYLHRHVLDCRPGTPRGMVPALFHRFLLAALGWILYLAIRMASRPGLRPQSKVLVGGHFRRVFDCRYGGLEAHDKELHCRHLPRDNYQHGQVHRAHEDGCIRVSRHRSSDSHRLHGIIWEVGIRTSLDSLRCRQVRPVRSCNLVGWFRVRAGSTRNVDMPCLV